MPFGRRSFLLRPFLMAPSPGVREGSHPLALSHGVAGRSQVRHTPRARPQNFDHPRFFPAPPGVREGSHPLALSRGVARRGQVCQTLLRAFSEFRIDSFFSRFAGGARGSTPSRALPWGRKTRPSVPRVRHTLPRASSGFRLLRFFPALPGVREGSHPLALSHGVVSRSRELQSIPLL